MSLLGWAVVLLLLAAVGGGGWVYYDRQRDTDAEGDEAGEEDAEVRALGAQVRDAGARLVDVLAGTDRKRAIWRMTGAVLVVGTVIAAVAAVAWLGWGPLAGGLFVAGLVAGLAGPPVAILVFREGIPGTAAIGLAIAAQIAFGKAALVRRADGRYEWTALREGARGYYARLDDGADVPIDADEGELFSFGFGKLAVVEERGEANVGPFRELDTPGASDTPTTERAGVGVVPPREENGGILVSLASIQRAIRGSASSKLVRRGRDKALDEEGGTGQLSELVTALLATGLLIGGFAMTAGALML